VCKRRRVTKEKLKEMKHENKTASNKVIVGAVYYWVPLTAKRTKQNKKQLSEMKRYRIFDFKAGTY